MSIVKKTNGTHDLFGKWRIGFTHDEIWNDDVLYLERWILWFGMTLRLHKFHMPDDVSRGIHDHPWWFWTLVLPTWLGNEHNFYIETRDHKHPSGSRQSNASRKVIAGLHYSPPDRIHAITWVHPGTRTVVLTGTAKNRDWGFYDRDGNFTVHHRG